MLDPKLLRKKAAHVRVVAARGHGRGRRVSPRGYLVALAERLEAQAAALEEAHGLRRDERRG